MNIYDLNNKLNIITKDNGINLVYIALPACYYGFFMDNGIGKRIEINNKLSYNVQVETLTHEIVHFFDIYTTNPFEREIIADYISIYLFEKYNLPLSYELYRINDIKKSFSMLKSTIFDNIISMLTHYDI